jgi:threonine dehydrogenase-like Zn-dependent dehydrogenase
MITAQIATLNAPRHLVFNSEQLDPANLPTGEILAETIVSAISPGTELAAYIGAPPLRPCVPYPRLVGYCNVARVIAISSDVSAVAIGDRILSFTSHRSHFRLPIDEVLAVIPDDIDSDDAVCAYLFHLGYSAALRADIRLGNTVVVLGLGVLGLGSVAMASLAGARVFAISDHDIPRKKALGFGAEKCFGRSDFPELMKVLGSRRAQAVITTSNSWADWQLALESTGDQGTIAVLGFPGRQESTIPLNPLNSAHFHDRQLRIIAAGLSPQKADSRGFLAFNNERDNLLRILNWIKNGRLNSAELVSGRFSGLKLADAYESLIRRDNSPLTYLLDWQG